MGKKKLACCVGLGVLLIAGNAEASDINPMKQHHEAVKKEYSAAVERQMDELSPARQEHAWALGEELGMAGAIPADVKKKIGDLAVEGAEARVIDNISINRARAALSSAAGDYEALKVRYGMREKMLPAWDKEKQKILSKLSGVKKTGSPIPFQESKYEEVYERTYRAEENIYRFYNGAFDPDWIKPYRKTADKAEAEFLNVSKQYAFKKSGITMEQVNDPDVDSLAERYARTDLLALQDNVQVKLLGERLKNQKKEYVKAASVYEKLYAREISRCSLPGGLAIAGIAEKGGSVAAGQAYGVSGILPAHTKEEREAMRDSIRQLMASVSSEDMDRLASRRAEYGSELSAMGYFDREAAKDQSTADTKAPAIQDKRFKVDGEMRVDYGAHHGEEAIGDRSRARLRVYGDYNIDDNWHFISMLENEKILSGRGDDNWMDLDRYYLTGMVGSSRLTAGVFSSYLAEGNIYDSKFKGIRISGETPFRYMAEAGTVPYGGMAAAGEVSKEAGDYTLGAGIYHFNMDDSPSRNIYMLNVRRPLGLYDVGLMGLVGSDSERKSQKGYVAALFRGEERTWDTGNTYYFLKYYYQPYTTYVSHTMEGMADYMHGFKGIGAGIHYTVAPNWLLQAEYYSLKDLINGDKNHTIWLALSYYFSNYEAN